MRFAFYSVLKGVRFRHGSNKQNNQLNSKRKLPSDHVVAFTQRVMSALTPFRQDNGPQRPCTPHTGTVSIVTSTSAFIQISVHRTFKPVQLISLALIQDRAPHDQVVTTKWGPVPNVIENSLPGPKLP